MGPWRVVTNFHTTQQTGQWTKEESNPAFLNHLLGKPLAKFLEFLVSFPLGQEEICTFNSYLNTFKFIDEKHHTRK